MADSQSTREKDLEEVRAIRDENIRRAGTHDRTEIHREVEGLTAAGAEKAKPMEIHVGGGVAYLNTHGEIRLDQEGIINAQKALAEAFQAVS